ncbi:MAG: hypothetical protein SF182_01045 [Deltaproteobacteria bacterium]|nr:hypothetical protein [Deltaproteobacteria bacterium]
MASKTTRRRAPLTLVLPKPLERAQAEAEKALTRGVKATLDLLPSDTRKAVRQLGAQLEETATALRARGRKVVTAVEKRGTSLVGEVERAVARLEKRRAKALKSADKESTRLIGLVQAHAGSVLRAVAETFDVASAQDVANLGKRLTQLERKLTGKPARKRAA